jgi:hypothetical protein
MGNDGSSPIFLTGETQHSYGHYFVEVLSLIRASAKDRISAGGI